MGQAKRGKKPNKGRFVGIPLSVANSQLFCQLSAHEVKLIVDLSAQYNGRNNGNLTACRSIMKNRGWANGTLGRTTASLIKNGWLLVTRQGWKERGKPTLVALTWYGIDEPPPKISYDPGIKPNLVPLNYWCKLSNTQQRQPEHEAPKS